MLHDEEEAEGSPCQFSLTYFSKLRLSEAFLSPSHCKPIQEFCFQYLSKQGPDLLGGAVLPPSLHQLGCGCLSWAVTPCCPSSERAGEERYRPSCCVWPPQAREMLHGKEGHGIFPSVSLPRHQWENCSWAQGWRHSCPIVIYNVCAAEGATPELQHQPQKSPLLTHISLCTDCFTSGSSLTHLEKKKPTCCTGMWGGSCNYITLEHIKMRISLFLQDFAYTINNLNCQ